LNRTGFDMPTIYVPSPTNKSRCVNQIEEVCKDVEKTINQTIQNTLNTLEKDCEQIAYLVDERLQKDKEASSHNFKARCRGLFLSLLGVLLPLFIFVNFLASSASKDLLHSTLGKKGTETLLLYVAPVKTVFATVPAEYHMHFIGGISCIALLFLLLAKYMSRSKSTLSRRQKRLLLEQRDFVQNIVKNKKQTLYSEYLKQSVADHDL